MSARTERLLLRPGWAEDAPALAETISDEMIIRNLACAPWPYARADAEQFLAGWTSGQPARFLMVQRTASSPRLIGAIGLDAEKETPELGFWIGRPYWGLGYATEAGRHIVELARTLGHRQIRAAHPGDNPASGGVLRKLGFRATGRRIPRFSAARGHEIASVEYVHDLGHGESTDAGVAAAMRCAQKWPAEKREAWRLHAA